MMHGWYYSNDMMGYGYGGFWFIGMLFSIVILIDFILLGVWLWKQIQKNGRR